MVHPLLLEDNSLNFNKHMSNHLRYGKYQWVCSQHCFIKSTSFWQNNDFKCFRWCDTINFRKFTSSISQQNCYSINCCSRCNSRNRQDKGNEIQVSWIPERKLCTVYKKTSTWYLSFLVDMHSSDKKGKNFWSLGNLTFGNNHTAFFEIILVN